MLTHKEKQEFFLKLLYIIKEKVINETHIADHSKIYKAMEREIKQVDKIIEDVEADIESSLKWV